MPSKRPTPLENSPSVSESSTEEEEDEEEEVEEDTLQVGTNSNPAPKPHSDEDSSDESSSDESESGDESDVPVEKQPTTKTDTPQAKRRLETEDKDSQKKKKIESGGEDQKKLFLRLWTDQDEIVILNGMIEFKNKGKNPSAQVTEFFESIKHLLRPDVNKLQVNGKIRTIRRKYRNAIKKVKNLGEDPEFSKPHDAKVYQLSKKVWYHGETINLAGTAGEKRKSKRVSKVTTLPNSDYTYLNASLLPRDVLTMPIPAPGLRQFFHKNLMGCSKAAGFDKRWKSVLIAETKAYLQRIELVKEQTQAVLDVLESSD